MFSKKKGFSDDFKMDVISYAKTLSIDAAVGQFGVARSSIRTWINDVERRGITIETMPLVAANKSMPASITPGPSKRKAKPKSGKPKRHSSAMELQRRRYSISDLTKAEKAVLQGYQSLREAAKSHNVPCSMLYSRISAKAKSHRRRSFDGKKVIGKRLDTAEVTTTKSPPQPSPKKNVSAHPHNDNFPPQSSPNKTSDVEIAKIEPERESTALVCVEKISEDQIKRYSNGGSAINAASDNLNKAKQVSISAGCKILACSAARLMDIVQYTTEHGYREAATRFRIGINKIMKIFEGTEIGEDLVELDQMQHQSLSDESMHSSSSLDAMQGGTLMNLMVDWLSGEFNSGNKPTLREICTKARGLACNDQEFLPFSTHSRILYFIRKAGFQRQWRMLMMKKNKKKSTEMEQVDKLLKKWVLRQIESGRKLLKSDISWKGVSIARRLGTSFNPHSKWATGFLSRNGLAGKWRASFKPKKTAATRQPIVTGKEVEVEKLLKKWVLEQIESGTHVRRSDICSKGLSISRSIGAYFSPDSAFATRFLTRNGLLGKWRASLQELQTVDARQHMVDQKRFQVDKLLKKWVLDQIESEMHVRKIDICSKGLSIARSIGAASFSPHSSGATRFLKRNGLFGKWRASFRALKTIDTRQDENVTSANTEEIMSEAVAYAELYGNGMAAKKFNIPEKSLCEWITKMTDLEMAELESSSANESQEGEKKFVKTSNSFSKRVPRRRPIVDSEIVEWIKAEKEKNGGRVPRTNLIQAKAREIAKRKNSCRFLASRGWFKKFKERNSELFAHEKALSEPISDDDDFLCEKNGSDAEIQPLPPTDCYSLSPITKGTVDSLRKRGRCPAMDTELVEWLVTEKEKNGGRVPYPRLIKAKAREVAEQKNIQNFKGSCGWFDSFKRRNYKLFVPKNTSTVTSEDDNFVCENNRSIVEVHSSPPMDCYSLSPIRSRTIEAESDQDAEERVLTKPNVNENNYATGIQRPFVQRTPIKRSPPHFYTNGHVNGFPGGAVSVQENQTAAAADEEDYADEGYGLSHIKEEILVVKRGFGSFHSSNVEEQIVFSETASYEPPAISVPPPRFKNYTDGSFVFGSVAKKLHFCLEQECVFLNHGAFGATLKEALRYLHEWQIYMEYQPLRFFDRVLFPQIIYVQKRLADFVGCKPSDLTLTSNVTTAINAVIQGLKLNGKSSIYYLNVTYGAVKKVIREVCFRTGAKPVEVEVIFPITELNDIVEMVRCTLTEGTTLAVFDHIPSNYAFAMPLKEIIQICHSRGVPVLIDGAHGLGQLPLNLSELGADYYAGNCHKWFCSPKGCGFLYVRKELQKSTSGLIISHGSEEGFHSQFLWTGAKDYCAYLSLHALFNFWNSVGAENIRKYCSTLLQKVISYFQSLWDAELLAPAKSHCMMCCISLPSRFFTGKARVTYADAEVIQNRLYSDFNIEVPIKCIQNKLYARISVHIHNQFEDYIEFVKAIIQIADKDEVFAY